MTCSSSTPFGVWHTNRPWRRQIYCTKVSAIQSAVAPAQCAPAAAAAGLDLAGEEQRDGGDRKHDADHGEGVAEAHDERLALDGRADRGDRLVLRDGRIGDAMRHEVLRQLVDPLAHFVAVERDRLADDVRMELLALGQDRRRASPCRPRRRDCAACWTGPMRRAASLGAMPAVVIAVIGVSTSAWPMARTMFGHEELVAGAVERQRDVHEAARGEDADADEADVARRRSASSAAARAG